MVSVPYIFFIVGFLGLLLTTDLQIQVVDVSKPDVQDIVYNEESSENTVSIPIASLKHASKGTS